jgi:hypothetical protein
VATFSVSPMNKMSKNRASCKILLPAETRMDIVFVSMNLAFHPVSLISAFYDCYQWTRSEWNFSVQHQFIILRHVAIAHGLHRSSVVVAASIRSNFTQACQIHQDKYGLDVQFSRETETQDKRTLDNVSWLRSFCFSTSL